jgi:glycosyltransferase involved in cell wall biosynthesis
MRCPTLDQLPQPSLAQTGWPWTSQTAGDQSGRAALRRGRPESPEIGREALRPYHDSPRITIVTPSFNQGAFLEATIRSVLLQGYPDLEYMVLDGGSTDASVDIIRRYENWLAYWTSEPDQGQADAVNKGWQRATGDILGYINSDDTYAPQTLRYVAETFARNPEIGLVYGRCRVIDEHGGVLRERRVREATLAEILRWSPSIPQPTMFMRRAAVQAVGLLRTDLHYTMDYELSLRIGLRYRWQFIPVLLANMRDHPAAKTAVDPLRHVEEGIEVAKEFFKQDLPADIRELKNKTLATLFVRKARVLARLGRGAEARTVIADALDLCSDPVVRRQAAVARGLSWIGPEAVDCLRRAKRAWLRTFTRGSP